ncbi:glycosyltransferase [bacterium]|nr:glycosyltransferase [bacterium]
MKILQCGQFYPPHIGGIEVTTQYIAEWLNEAGIKCDVLCTNDNNKSVQEEHHSHTVYRSASLGMVASVVLSLPYIKKLKSLTPNYDILHIHAPNPLANLALLFVPKNVKVVLHWHSDIVKQKNLLKLYEPLQEYLLKRANAIIATSPKYAAESPYLLRYKEKVISIPLTIDTKRLVVNPQIVQEIKQRFKGRKIIYSLGRLAYNKGYNYLIDAATYLDDSYVVLIGGDGPLKQDLETQIKNLKLDNKVILLGKIPEADLGSYYEACDLFCLSSTQKTEAFGLVLLEAMSKGKPLVATKILGSGVDWVNQHNETGLNVEPNNAKDLASAIEQILNNAELYEKFKLNCLKRFENYFSKDKFMASLIQLYKRLA